MKNTLIVGYMGSGKSLVVRKILSQLTGFPSCVYDINNEYSKDATLRKINRALEDNDVFGANALTNYHENIDYSKMYFEKDFDKFQSRVISVKNNICVFEEATIGFSNKGREKNTINVLTRRRHIDSTEMGTGNMNLLLFHSLMRVPDYIIELIDNIYLFGTNDNPEKVKKKFEDYNTIYEHYLEVREKSAENKHFSVYFDNKI